MRGGSNRRGRSSGRWGRFRLECDKACVQDIETIQDKPKEAKEGVKGDWVRAHGDGKGGGTGVE